MNPTMWASKALQRNLDLLRSDGHYIIPPTEAISATTGQWDKGLTPNPQETLLHVQHVRMRELRDSYRAEATREKARTPLEAKLLQIEFSPPSRGVMSLSGVAAD
jgi:phosphopantothenoylcysteine synthetase/decarboxylase